MGRKFEIRKRIFRCPSITQKEFDDEKVLKRMACKKEFDLPPQSHSSQHACAADHGVRSTDTLSGHCQQRSSVRAFKRRSNVVVPRRRVV